MLRKPEREPKPLPNRAGPRARAEEALRFLSGCSIRRIGGRRVYVPPQGPPFVLTRKLDGRPKRMSGEIIPCESCGKEMFRRNNGGKNWTNCSLQCGSRRLSKRHHDRSILRGGPRKTTLDRWFSLIVRSVGRCRRCGSTESLQCAHIISRRYLGIRFSTDNALCLCAKDHLFYTFRPLEWEAYIVDLVGREKFEDLKRRALSFVGPLDRVAVAAQLYAEAERRDLRLKGSLDILDGRD